MGNNHSDHSHDSHEGPHIVPEKVFVKIFFTLVVLTVITIVVAKWRFWFEGYSFAGLFDFGQWNIIVSMFIASIKAVLVVLFFMHLKYEDGVIWTYFVFPIFLIFLLMAGIAIDNPLRKKVSHFVIEEAQSSPEKDSAH
jgi:cytochrome c oxidase subunit 4